MFKVEAMAARDPSDSSSAHLDVVQEIDPNAAEEHVFQMEDPHKIAVRRKPRSVSKRQPAG